MRRTNDTSTAAPTLSRRLVRIFTRYSRGYTARHFHAVRLLKSHQLAADFAELPVAIFLNHASWWDPLICLLLAQTFFQRRDSFAPIDAGALQRYGLLRRLGFFGVTRDARGAATFLRTSRNILASRNNVLWITPQGEFTDVRSRPVRLQKGVAHLAASVAPAVFLPLAIEYTFWEERSPEVLVAFGTPLFTQHHENSCGSDDWSEAFESTLEAAQAGLADASQRRDASEWESLLRGSSGTNAIYDTWRRISGSLRGEEFRKDHSGL